MPKPKPDPFREWIERCLETVERTTFAVRCGVSVNSMHDWRRGGGVAVANMARVKLEAAKDGVILSTDDLLPRKKT